MINLPFFSKKKLLLSFEFGVILSETAKDMGVELTPEIMARAEKMIESEFRTSNPTELSVLMVPLILTAFELDITK